ncbi:ABC transporter ATP-binding protein [Oceanibaculum pacificum]|uniref:ABC transporter ATP-binding protein n=1 Tax=Oceanibaculum pacificum TaxID=580166 RepID=A0A154VS96_9PROT|nr:ABC transporter ATP-binding protein [Oceanibaculum pacificum]KZD04098.1 ABC transporter ATP-binding protein [Oceanibaculum pacificum]
MLSLRNVRAGYGGKEVLHGLNLAVPRGAVVTLLGANGAGKSTTLNAIVGLARCSDGSIELDGVPLTNGTPDQALRRGIALVAEQRELFGGMSVSDNLRLGGLLRGRSRAVAEDFEKLLDTFPRLRERLAQPARTLSGGEQQMLAIARALMARPAYLLLDEPSLGLAPRIVDEIFDIIRRISGEDTTILLVEQNAMLALEVADYGYVIETGEITFEGDADALRGSAAVQESYL